jgi:hypothetical protein
VHVAWPIGISKTQKVKQVISKKKSLLVGSYALTGVTLTSQERKPIKKTLIFPHRMFEPPFQQPIPNVRFDTINHFPPNSSIFLLSIMSFRLLVSLLPYPFPCVISYPKLLSRYNVCNLFDIIVQVKREPIFEPCEALTQQGAKPLEY